MTSPPILITALGWATLIGIVFWFLWGLAEVSLHIDRPEHHRRIRETGWTLPPSRLRIRAMPDLATLRWIRGHSYVRLVTSSGRHVHYAPAASLHDRNLHTLCQVGVGNARRATNRDLANKTVCADCQHNLRGER